MPDSKKSKVKMVFHLKAFLITVSFRTDINDECIKWIKKYLGNNAKYHYTVVEHGESGVAHLHTIFYTDEAKNGADIKNQWWKALDPKQNDDSKRKYAIKVNVCHDQTWYDEYLKKENDCTIITDEWPRDETVLTSYYPDEATQKALQAIGKAGYARSDVSDMLEGYQSFLDQEVVGALRSEIFMVLMSLVEANLVLSRGSSAALLVMFLKTLL